VHVEDFAVGADVRVLPAGPPAEVAGEIARVRESAGVRAPRFAIAVRPLVGDDAARVATVRRRLMRVAPVPLADDADAALAAVTGVSGGAGALVGTPDVVAERLVEYAAAGVEIVQLRGFDPIGDVDRYAEVIAAVRAQLSPVRPRRLTAHVA
jgi:alkanesulfonate monooxygenase SsuD/methylene tetrahydromethanopterin reductase-like flavin-dependent oxidoreductase (luciferase family)